MTEEEKAEAEAGKAKAKAPDLKKKGLEAEPTPAELAQHAEEKKEREEANERAK